MIFKQKILVSFIFIIISLSLQAQQKNQMYKNPGCMCCDKWVKHMNENGFDLGITPSTKMKELKKEEKDSPKTVNNALFVGSTSDLSKLLKNGVLNNKVEKEEEWNHFQILD